MSIDMRKFNRGRGRPSGSVKFKDDNGNPIGHKEYKKLQQQKRAEVKAREFESKDYRLDEKLHLKIDRALEVFNQRHSSRISKSDFIRIALSLYCEEELKIGQ